MRHQLRIIITLGIYTFLSVIIHSHNCSSTVKLEVTVNTNYMTLSCLVTNRNLLKNIYLLCPLVDTQLNCRENCDERCQDNNCKLDSLIKCRDMGVNTETKVYQIDYVIDGSRAENHGKWMCQYGGQSSSVVYVNASSSKAIVPQKYIPTTKPSVDTINKPNIGMNEASQDQTMGKSNSSKKLSIAGADDSGDNVQYDKLLTKSEFIMTVIGLLALSLICNIFFCCRMTIVHFRSKKQPLGNGQYFSMNPENPPYNRSNSQVSDSERIYEDTSIHNRQMSFLTQIKNANGNYLAQSTLSPPSGLSTMLPHLSFNQPLSYNNSQADNGSNQINYSFLSDPMQVANYASVNFPVENNYTNFVSGNGNMTQPVYLAFQSTHPIMTAGNRYVQYSNQPLQSITPPSNDSRSDSKKSEASSVTVLAQASSSGNGSNNVQDEGHGKSNYQLSREMMEEADNLLRTADTLLRSTEDEIKFYQQ